MNNNPSQAFFISYSSRNIKFAREVDAILKAKGYATIRQEDHFGTMNFVAAISNGLDSGARVIALFSEAYFSSEFCLAEAYTVLAGDPLNKTQRLIPIRIDECSPPGLLSGIAYVDLVPSQPTGEELKKIILNVVQPNAKQLTKDGHGLWKAPRTILHPEIEPVPNFTARADELKQLKDILFSGQTAAVTATISAMGGVGKTVLAREYGWEHRDEYAGVWLIPAESREAIVSGLVQFGSKIDSTVNGIEDRNEAAQLTLQIIADAGFAKRWLLIYDNVEDPSALKGLTPKDGAHILVTSRWTDWSGHAQVLDLKLFSDEEAVQFLLDRTNSTDEDGAKQLAELLGNLPLALEQAAAYCQHGVSFADYIESYQKMLKKQPKKSADYPDSVWATFTLALNSVIEGDGDKERAPCPETAKLLNIAAYLAPDDIPLDIFSTDYLAVDERVEAINALADVSLIKTVTLSDGSAAFSLHRLVQEVVRDKVQEDGEAEQSKMCAAKLISKSLPRNSDDIGVWPQVQKLSAHILVLAETLPDEGEASHTTARIIFGYGRYLFSCGEYASCETFFRRALKIAENNSNQGYPDQGTALNGLANLLQTIANLKKKDKARLEAEAEKLYRRALSIKEDTLGPDHADVAHPLNNLANLLRTQNKVEEAEKLIKRALRIREKSLGSDHSEVADSLNTLAALYQESDRMAYAEPLYRRALKIKEDSLGPDHPDVVHPLNNLAELLQATNRMDEVEPLYSRALEIMDKALGPDHPLTIEVRDNFNSFLAEKQTSEMKT